MTLIVFTIIQILLFALASIYLYVKWVYRHWQQHKVPFIEPTFPMGTSGNPFTCTTAPGPLAKNHYDYFKRNGHRFGGLYNVIHPTLLWVDLELIKNVLARDFHHFTDRGIFSIKKQHTIDLNLFNLNGKSWKNMRVKLTPTFTSIKMKMMFGTLVACSESLIKKMDELADGKTEIDVKEVLGCYATDVIGSCAFGIECNSFDEGASVFRQYGRKIFETTFTRLFSSLAIFAFPKIADFLGITIDNKNVRDFFLNAVKEMVDYREKNQVVRKDFLQLLLDMKGEEDGLTIEEIAAQCFVFFVAGFETSSTTMTFALYELSRHKAIQARVRKEIEEVLERYDGLVTYEAIQDMKYLDQVIKETLRMYPPIPILHRKCTIDYKIPGTEITLNREEKTIISVMGLHYDPEYYPDPQKFQPDRFTDEAKVKIPQFAYIPFGDGPRNCIGLRFGLMQSKVGLVTLIKDYEISVHSKTVDPFRFDPKTFILTTQGGMWLKAIKIQ